MLQNSKHVDVVFDKPDRVLVKIIKSNSLSTCNTKKKKEVFLITY